MSVEEEAGWSAVGAGWRTPPPPPEICIAPTRIAHALHTHTRARPSARMRLCSLRAVPTAPAGAGRPPTDGSMGSVRMGGRKLPAVRPRVRRRTTLLLCRPPRPDAAARRRTRTARHSQ